MGIFASFSQATVSLLSGIATTGEAINSAANGVNYYAKVFESTARESYESAEAKRISNASDILEHEED